MMSSGSGNGRKADGESDGAGTNPVNRTGDQRVHTSSAGADRQRGITSTIDTAASITTNRNPSAPSSLSKRSPAGTSAWARSSPRNLIDTTTAGTTARTTNMSATATPTVNSSRRSAPRRISRTPPSGEAKNGGAGTTPPSSGTDKSRKAKLLTTPKSAQRSHGTATKKDYSDVASLGDAKPSPSLTATAPRNVLPEMSGARKLPTRGAVSKASPPTSTARISSPQKTNTSSTSTAMSHESAVRRNDKDSPVEHRTPEKSRRAGEPKPAPQSAAQRKAAMAPSSNSNKSSPPCPRSCPICGDHCTCGDDCSCLEELCQCQAYQVLQSVSPVKGKSCCSSSRTTKETPLGVIPKEYSGSTVDPLAPPPSENEERKDGHGLYRAELSIAGMTCSMCSQAIENAVRNLSPDYIEQVDISLTTDSALVVWRDPVRLEDVRTAIEDIGYTVDDVRLLTNASATADVADEDQETVEERWERYRRRQNDKVKQRRCAFLWALVATIPVITLTMILPHIVPDLFHHKHVLLPFLRKQLDLEALVLWALATPVQFICGFEFYKMAWFGFQSGTAGMDVLVAMGTTASYGYALSGAWNGDEHAAHFFETSAVLICFVLAGKWMQAAAVRRTSEALTQLMELQSPTAVKITPLQAQRKPFNPLRDAYREEVLDTHEILAGDMVKVIRGASVPADGRVLYGEISVDESMITGESIPILKSPGSLVLGGTICVESGVVDTDDEDIQKENVGAAFIEVTGVGSSTALSQIIELVQHAQTQAVPIQTFADQVSAIFVPAVCTISVITYLVWYALCSSNVVPEKWYRDELGEDAATFSLKFSIACLVISCPCALGLATPTAVMVGAAVGARCGVLMKGGETLETASKVDSVVFDKTGTLTLGKPSVTDFIRINNKKNGESSDKEQDIADQDYLLWLLGSLERTSEHPLARAIVTYAEEQLGDALDNNPFVQPSKFRGVIGRGASGVILGNVSLAVGNLSFAAIMDMVVPPQAVEWMNRLEEDGKTAILAAVEGKVCAVLGIADEMKADAADSIVYLRDSMGVDVWMVTGDNARTAAAISRRLGIPSNRVISEALPAAKLEKVCALQDEGRVVAMVGDGVNDSPALASADVGMSLGTGAEIATEASDMVLVKGHCADVCTALHLSRAIFSRIRWNLFWSLLYNSLGIPIAAGAFYPLVRARLPPTVAAVAMALSSVSVVLSSLTLRFYRPPSVGESAGNRRRRVTTAWARSMPGRESRPVESNEMTVNLLSSDHLSNSELTTRVDNRTTTRMEEG